MTGRLSVGIVGPIPPPNGGMAMQTLQLINLLKQESIRVEFVATNFPYRPAIIEKLKVVRALFRLVPYFVRIWFLAGKVDVIHLMANSGWSWQLFAAPMIWVGKFRRVPVIVNYRGGEARRYLSTSSSRVLPTLTKASCVVAPSGYLKAVFGDFGVEALVIPNIIDLDLFKPKERNFKKDDYRDPRRFVIVITRNLESIYGLDSAIRCIDLVKNQFPEVVLKIAGTGPELDNLVEIVEQLDLQAHVEFLGRLDRSQVAALYQSADAMLNPSLVDNMPNSVIEALACGLPIVSTNVGGVPFLLEHNRTALLVDPGDIDAMAACLVSIRSDESIADRLTKCGRKLAHSFSWETVGKQWISLYESEAMST